MPWYLSVYRTSGPEASIPSESVAPLGRSTSLPIGMSDALGIDDYQAAQRLDIKYVV